MASTNLIDEDAEYNAPSDEVPPTQAHNNAGTLKRKPTGSPHSPSTRKVSCQKIGDANFSDPSDLEGILHSKIAELLPIGTPWPPEIEIDDNAIRTTMLQLQIETVDVFLCIRKEYDEMRARITKEYNEMRAALASTVESFDNLKAIATEALKHAWSKVEVAQAELTAAKEKINILEAASNEEKIERLITENQDCTEALKKANGELQVALSDLGTALTKNNLLQTANTESMITINRLRAENEDTQAELNFVKNKNNSLEAAADEWHTFTKKQKVECAEEHTKDLNLAKAELEHLHKLVASSATVEAQLVDASLNEIADIENTAEVGRNLESLRKSCYKCVLQNRLLKMEVGTQKIKLESYQEQSRLNQKLNDENKEMKTKLYEMAGDLDMLKTKLYEMAGNLDMASITERQSQ